MLARVSGGPSSEKGPGGQVRLGRGDVVGERWRLDEFLKGGGMGRVWRATDLRLLEPVAVKLLDPAGLEADGAREAADVHLEFVRTTVRRVEDDLARAERAAAAPDLGTIR